MKLMYSVPEDVFETILTSRPRPRLPDQLRLRQNHPGRDAALDRGIAMQ